MFCNNCGRANGESACYCYYCGTPLASPGLPGTDARPGPGPVRVPWTERQVALGVGLVFLGIFVIVGGITFLIIQLEVGQGPAWISWVGSHVLGVIILAVVWKIGFRRSARSWPTLGLVHPRPFREAAEAERAGLRNWGVAGLLALLALLASLGFTAGYALLLRSLGLGALAPPEVTREVTFSGPAALLSFEAIAGWTPLTEEIFFRGFIFAGLVARRGIWGGVVISSLVFSVFHLDPRVFVPIFVTGALLAWLYYRTGSLWPGIGAHAAQNGVALLVTILEVKV